jgi:hypothetical protein
MDMVYIAGQVVKAMKGFSSTIICMEEEYLLGLMVRYT